MEYWSSHNATNILTKIFYFGSDWNSGGGRSLECDDRRRVVDGEGVTR